MAPGLSHPAAAMQAGAGLPARPSFAPPANMPNINFNAPVIRMGTSGPGRDSGRVGDSGHNQGRRGLGMDRGGDHPRGQRENQTLIPPTREEVMRTIFIGKIPNAINDEALERILRAAGGLRRWTRAYDADGKACTFGFAEYEDAESLETAADVLPEVEVPTARPTAKKETIKTEDEEEELKPEKAKLLVQVDEASKNYAQEWREKRGEDDSAHQFRVDGANDALASVLVDLFNPAYNGHDTSGDINMNDVDIKADPVTGEVMMIPITGEDELADIPAEMRETVSAEIQSFRDRSTRRDLERLKREEEMEALERRNGRANRLASPPISAPTGPAGANGIPLGPREGPRGAPSGPKGYQNNQNTVHFTNGSHPIYITADEEASDASDDELERRRQEKKQIEQDKLFQDYERRWLNRERSRAAAVDREQARDEGESSTLQRAKDAMARRLKDFNDDSEASRRTEEYYRDRNVWLRNRLAFRSREKEADDRDRAQELREKSRENDRQKPLRGASESLHGPENDLRGLVREPQRLKISLGAAAQRAQAAAPRRTIAEVEGLLEDEEETTTTTKRTLVPIKFDSAAEAAGLTEEERQQAARQLAADIPTDKNGLWTWKVQWDFLDEAVLTDQIRPFVEKKMLEYLGVQEEMLVDVVEEHIKNRGSPQDLIKELEGVSHYIMQH